MIMSQNLDQIMSQYLLHQSKSNQIVQNLVDSLLQQNAQLSKALQESNEKLSKLEDKVIKNKK